MKSIRLDDDCYDQLKQIMVAMKAQSFSGCVRELVLRYELDCLDDHAILVSLQREVSALREGLSKQKQTKRSTVQDVFAMTCDETFIKQSSWVEWVKHLLNMGGMKVNLYQGQLHMNLFRSFYEQYNLDIDELIKHLISEGARKPYIPASWRGQLF